MDAHSHALKSPINAKFAYVCKPVMSTALSTKSSKQKYTNQHLLSRVTNVFLPGWMSHKLKSMCCPIVDDNVSQTSKYNETKKALGQP